MNKMKGAAIPACTTEAGGLVAYNNMATDEWLIVHGAAFVSKLLGHYGNV